MRLAANNLEHIEPKSNLELPEPAHLQLPEKVLQFGTGVLLRGLPDYYIDKANKQGVFNGRIVIVKSTDRNRASDFDEQDNLYTVCVKGIEDGRKVDRYHVNAAVSRVLTATEHWDAVLELATSADLQVVISNTTELGIVLKKDDVIAGNQAPESFPGKLVSFLYKRFQHFEGSEASGLVILPTELIGDNGGRLKAYCLELAQINDLGEAFTNWLTTANDFCNTLVDRIVPGLLNAHDKRKAASYLGFDDDLMIMSEVYSLWAIETSSERTRGILSFAKASGRIVVTPNIERFRNLKLRLLNGAHTFSCGLALLSGFETVKEAMENGFFERYLNDLMVAEITKTLVGDDIRDEEAVHFARSVMDRFRNPYIEHRWESIATNYSSKMMMRNIPTLLTWYERFPGKVPAAMALGFASYIYFMRSEQTGEDKYVRNNYGKQILIDDYLAGKMYAHWQTTSCEEAVQRVLSDDSLWGTDLTKLHGFEDAVMNNIRKLRTQTKLNSNKATV
ncbi:MAG: tagaturonate reductase [Sphingobacteriales bacterium]|nr:MAG: tagaturonate reductase [Sphingobacteriales bacterium]